MRVKHHRTKEAQRIAELVDELPRAVRERLLDMVLCVLGSPIPVDPLDAESLPGNVIQIRSHGRLP